MFSFLKQVCVWAINNLRVIESFRTFEYVTYMLIPGDMSDVVDDTYEHFTNDMNDGD